jgi:hypothetical protein
MERLDAVYRGWDFVPCGDAVSRVAARRGFHSKSPESEAAQNGLERPDHMI